MSKRHKHYDVIVAWAEGEKVEARIGGTWMEIASEQPFFCESTEYRVKPKTVKKEGWVNVYANRIVGLKAYCTKEEAHKQKGAEGRVTCIRIEWEEEE